VNPNNEYEEEDNAILGALPTLSCITCLAQVHFGGPFAIPASPEAGTLAVACRRLPPRGPLVILISLPSQHPLGVGEVQRLNKRVRLLGIGYCQQQEIR
jgi:hypothetical protein